MRYADGVIESFVDLTYRGLALGRRIKLTEVRPTTGTLELAAPMPVGTQLAIATDDGVTLDATVLWVHEQVAGSDRTPGMTVAPVLAGDAAAAWWQARVALPEDDRPRRPSRTKPVTLRPRPATGRTRAATDRTPPPAHAVAEPGLVDEVTLADAPPRARAAPDSPDTPDAPDAPEMRQSPDTIAEPRTAHTVTTREVPTILADLEARVAAAAGLDRKPGAGDHPTVAMSPVEQSVLAEATRPAPGRVGEPLRRTGEHAVVDDGNATMIMDAVDPATFGLDFPTTADGAPVAIGDEPSAPTITIEAGGPGEPMVATEASAIADDGDPDDDGDGGGGGGEPNASAAAPDKPAGRGFKRRRKRR